MCGAMMHQTLVCMWKLQDSVVLCHRHIARRHWMQCLFQTVWASSAAGPVYST